MLLMMQVHRGCLYSGAVLHTGRDVVGKHALMDFAALASGLHGVVRGYLEFCNRQIKNLANFTHFCLGQCALARAAFLRHFVANGGVGVLHLLECFANVTGLPAWFATAGFAQ